MQAQPEELGDVHWLRSMAEAQKLSAKEQKPILILFQEIPGCSTCRAYGNDVLRLPMIVETIETEFIPLAIYNNKGGDDAAVLRKYGEPAWNNPVVRIVDASGDDVVPRLGSDYTAEGLAARMRQALITTTGQAPGYVRLMTEELHARVHGTSNTTYSMHCFWAGEALFGKVHGVVKTTAGFQNGREVVAVEYDPLVITKDELDKIAESEQCYISSGGSFRADSTPKYYLSNSRYNDIPMSEIQKCRVNSALAERQSPDEFLSPRQLGMLKS